MGRKALPVRLPTLEEEQSAIDSTVDFDLDGHLRATAIVASINANLPDGAQQLAPIPSEYVFKRRDSASVSVALHSAFELIGGVPRLVQWAQHNPEKFFGMYVKMLPSSQETSQGSMTVNIISDVPHSPLDDVSIADDGSVVDVDVNELPE